MKIVKYYSLDFIFNPNYNLVRVRKFILEKNEKLKIPFKKNYILFDKDIKVILNPNELNNG
jgi:hypothetical protein